MIEVTGQAYSPTLLTGAATALTPNRLPLDALTGLLDQPGGIRLSGIDVVSSGLRVRRGTGYPPLYSTLLADRPAAGQRRTYLVVRLDMANSVGGLTLPLDGRRGGGCGDRTHRQRAAAARCAR